MHTKNNGTKVQTNRNQVTFFDGLFQKFNQIQWLMCGLTALQMLLFARIKVKSQRRKKTTTITKNSSQNIFISKQRID